MSGATQTRAQAVGERLRSVRQSAGLTQAQLAASLGLTQAAVSNWEAGTRQPGLDDIYAIAAVFDVDLLDLLPRRGQGVPVRAALRAVVGELDQGALWQAIEGFIEEAERVPRLIPSVTTRATKPETAAEDLLGQVGASGEPVDVEAVAHACAVPVLEWPFDDAVSGLVVDTDDGPVIGINKRHHLNRRRFSLGHELGHVVLRHLETFHLDLGVAALDGTPPNYNWRHERAANDFAAALLMPADLVRRAHGESPHLSTLAERFKVSRIAMGFRMKALDVT